ncbi:hypothetical protein JCM30760_03210 [Thiomicrorhabdus hydrogeniphila]
MLQGTTGLRSNDNAPAIFRIFDISILIVTLIIIVSLYGLTFDNNYVTILTLTLVFFLYLTEAMGLYRKLRLDQFTKRVMVIFASTTLSFLLVTSTLFLLKESETFSRFVIFSWYIFSLISFISWRIIYRHTKRNLYKQGINLELMKKTGV